MARTRGFDRPLTTNQVASWIGNALATAWFYGVVAWVLLRDRRHCNERIVAILVIPHVCCVVVGLCCWLFMETHPPTKASCFGSLLGDTPRWTKKRYCREHKASIEGLDHFCTWLNVSVGRQNYVPFYLLSAAGTVQYALHTAICVFIIVSCKRPMQLGALVVIGACGLMGFCILLAYAALFGFHTYLAFLGVGTYDWIIDQRKAPQTTEMTGRVGDSVG
jgi:hypothetical protein